MKDSHKPFCVLPAFRGLKSLSRDSYEGSTQALSRLGCIYKAQILTTGELKRIHTSLSHFGYTYGVSNPYHGTVLKDPQKPFRVLAALTGAQILITGQL